MMTLAGERLRQNAASTGPHAATRGLESERERKAVVMTCAACGTPLPAGAKFCAECGTPTATACRVCGTELPTGAKFCLECGTPAVPARAGGCRCRRGVAARRPAPVAERRVTSVLFGDLVGFTSLSEVRDPEEVRELLGRYFDTARGDRGPLRRHDREVHRGRGDGGVGRADRARGRRRAGGAGRARSGRGGGGVRRVGRGARAGHAGRRRYRRGGGDAGRDQPGHGGRRRGQHGGAGAGQGRRRARSGSTRRPGH